jgi:N-acetylglucosaminyldiphosphoundecaprenol N-acetyl-beta-D-mannosaminyltransferase
MKLSKDRRVPCDDGIAEMLIDRLPLHPSQHPIVFRMKPAEMAITRCSYSPERVAVQNILGVNIAVSSYGDVVNACTAWADAGESHSVFFANVHMLMEAHDRPAFRAKLNTADMINPDGMPLVWALHALRQHDARRVYGPDATEALLRAAQNSQIAIGFYGGTVTTLDQLLSNVKSRYPGIRIVFAMSPPFRLVSKTEDESIVKQIADSGARFLFVGLGCPKQEGWIIDHTGRIPAVMLGVGAAMDDAQRT